MTLIKILETRDSNSLKCYIGKRVGLVRTGCGKPTLEGFVTIEGVMVANNPKEFHEYYEYHRVKEGSKYDIKEVKYMYILTNPVRCKPKLINNVGRIATIVDVEVA